MRTEHYAERRGRLFGKVRKTIILLFVATIAVVVFNHRMEVQEFTSAQLHKVAKHSKASDSLRQSALNYEKSVDRINK